MEHNPDIVASIAASLLDHRQLGVEPHHIRAAVMAARDILDAAHAEDARGAVHVADPA